MYMKVVPCKLRVKGQFPSGSNLYETFDNIALESKYNNTLIKVIDVQQHNLSPDVIYPMSYLMSLASVITEPSKINFMHDIIFNCYNYLHFLDKHNVPFRLDTLIVLANVSNMDNAFWNSSYLVFGNGTYNHTALTSSMIVAHELTHALIDSSAPLEYEGLSGALNESFADVFGVCFEFWIHDLYSTLGFELGSETGLLLRNMKDPEICNQPRRVNDSYYIEPSSSYDNGGVHINSGIPNHVFYSIQEAIGWKKAFDLFIRVLFKLTRYSTFKDFKHAIKAVNLNMQFIEAKKLTSIIEEHGI